MSSSDERHDSPDDNQAGNVSRRNFLKSTSVALSIPILAKGDTGAEAAIADVPVLGPDPVDITLTINGAKKTAKVEPRMTLLDTLRHDLDITGAKRVCDRATCGACTVIMDGKAVYSCTVLAIEAQGHRIQTIEGLEQNGKLSAVQQAFWENDAQQCGFCTPGFVMACTALLAKHPKPTEEQIKMGVGGNLCRCGTYDGIKGAIAQVAAGGRSLGKGGKS
jgi:xanthine dehydrogenase YagT iron-sulfur-binding subunit